MSKSGGSYPHPVYGHADDIDAVFEIADVKQTSTLTDVICQFRLSLDDPQLLQMMENGTAQLLAIWTCNATLQRGVIEPQMITNLSSARLYRFQIPQDITNGRINVDVQIHATIAMDNYRPLKAHRSYGDFSFSLERGDVIGIAGTFTLEAHKLYDPMQPPIDSIFRMVHSRELTGPLDMRLDLSGSEYIRIELSKETYERFSGLRSQPEMQISMVVFPALISALAEIQNDSEEEFQDLHWFTSLNRQLVSAGLIGQNPLYQAQMLLPNPALRGMLANAEGEGEIPE